MPQNTKENAMETNSSITPGKWIFDEDQTPHVTGFGGGSMPYLAVITGSSETIHVCGNGTTNSRADARLIAAAPKLLQSLGLLLEAYRQDYEYLARNGDNVCH